MGTNARECPECHGEDEDCPFCQEEVQAGGSEEEIRRVSALAQKELEGSTIGQFNLIAG